MDYKNINDYELISRIRENDDDAINIMVKKYEPIVVNKAKKYYVKNKYQGADMSDLVQEGRIAVFKAMNSYDCSNGTLFFTYVSHCIDCHFITYSRSLGASKYLPLNCSVSDECIYDVGDNTFDPELYILKRVDDNVIYNIINSLDFLDSNIFELRYNGFSYKEIASLLDISISSIFRHLCKIKQTLQVIKDKN